MSSSQLLLTPSFFRGVGWPPANQLDTLESSYTKFQMLICIWCLNCRIHGSIDVRHIFVARKKQMDIASMQKKTDETTPSGNIAIIAIEHHHV